MLPAAQRMLRLAAPTLLSALFLVSPFRAVAVPAAGNYIHIQQPNGTGIDLLLKGNGEIAWHETTDGIAVVYDSRQECWMYAELQPNGTLGPGKAPVGDSSVSRSSLIRNWNGPSPAKLEIEREPLTAKTERTAPTDSAPAYVPGATGVLRHLVLLARFADHNESMHDSWRSYVSLYNDIPYSATGAAGSVRQYFREVSRGGLDPLTVVFPTGGAWLALPRNEAYYGADDGGTIDARANELIYDAVQAASSAGLDFTYFDGNGDGWIDALTILHSGYGQEWTGNPSTTVWSRLDSLPRSLWDRNKFIITTNTGVRISRAMLVSAYSGSVGGRMIQRIGIPCYGLIRMLGMPSLAGAPGQGEGIGAWGLLGRGLYGVDGVNHPERPVHPCAWTKLQLGWLTPREIHSGESVVLRPASSTGDVALIRDGLPPGEFFLVEYRPAQGFDGDLPGGGGLLVWHCDHNVFDNGNRNAYLVALEEADGNGSLRSGIPAEAGDPFPGAEGKTQWTDSAGNPVDSGPASGVILENIAANGNTATFRVFSRVPHLLPPDAGNHDGSVLLRWGEVPDAAGYEVQEGRPVAASSLYDNAEDEGQFRENWLELGDFLRVTEPVIANRCYLAELYNRFQAVLRAPVSILHLRQRVRVTPATEIRYRYRHFLSNETIPRNRAYLQIRGIHDLDWQNLRVYAGPGGVGMRNWQEEYITTNHLVLHALVGREVELRFLVVNHAAHVLAVEYPPYWPENGMAIDDFRLEHVEYSSVDNWTTVSNSIGTTEITLQRPSPAPTTYAYRVRAQVNGVWGTWSNVRTVTVIVNSPTPTPTPTDAHSATPIATPADTPTDTPAVTPTLTPTYSHTMTPTDTPTATSTTTSTFTRISTSTVTPTLTPTYSHTTTPTDTLTVTPTTTSTLTHTPTHTPTVVFTPTSTVTSAIGTPSDTPTATSTTTPTSSPTLSPAPTETQTPVATAGNTATATSLVTPSPTVALPTQTPSSTETPNQNQTATPSPMWTPTDTLTPAHTATRTPTQTPTRTPTSPSRNSSFLRLR